MPKVKKKRFCVCRIRPLTPFDLCPDEFLCQMKGIIKLHSPDKFFEENIFDSYFRDLQKLA